MVNVKKEKKDKRTNLVHIAFSENELKLIDQYKEESSNTTRTDFIREAVNEKIRRIENPDLFIEKINVGIDNEQLKEILGMATENKEKIDLLLNNVKIFNQIQNTLNTLSSRINRPELKEKELKVIELLREYKELKPNKIMKLAKIENINMVYDIISDKEIFSINIKTGGIRLNDSTNQ